MNAVVTAPLPTALAPCARAACRVDRDVLDALIDEAIESAVAQACVRAEQRRAPAPAAARSPAPPADPWVVEALVDEILEELAGAGTCLPAPARHAPCTG